jgi:hypothetical protein
MTVLVIALPILGIDCAKTAPYHKKRRLAVDNNHTRFFFMTMRGRYKIVYDIDIITMSS